MRLALPNVAPAGCGAAARFLPQHVGKAERKGRQAAQAHRFTAVDAAAGVGGAKDAKHGSGVRGRGSGICLSFSFSFSPAQTFEKEKEKENEKDNEKENLGPLDIHPSSYRNRGGVHQFGCGGSSKGIS